MDIWIYGYGKENGKENGKEMEIEMERKWK